MVLVADGHHGGGVLRRSLRAHYLPDVPGPIVGPFGGTAFYQIVLYIANPPTVAETLGHRHLAQAVGIPASPSISSRLGPPYPGR